VGYGLTRAFARWSRRRNVDQGAAKTRGRKTPCWQRGDYERRDSPRVAGGPGSPTRPVLPRWGGRERSPRRKPWGCGFPRDRSPRSGRKNHFQRKRSSQDQTAQTPRMQGPLGPKDSSPGRKPGVSGVMMVEREGAPRDGARALIVRRETRYPHPSKGGSGGAPSRVRVAQNI
jgi:hypothetical protein